MPIKNILLPEYNFVYTYYFRSIDDMQVRAYSDRLKTELTQFEKYSEIIDFSHNVDFNGLSSATLNRAGYLEKERPHTKSGKLAMVVSDPLTYGLARTYTTFAADVRQDILISYNLEDCLAFMNFSNHQRIQVQQAIHHNLQETAGLYRSTQLEFNFPADH